MTWNVHKKKKKQNEKKIRYCELELSSTEKSSVFMKFLASESDENSQFNVHIYIMFWYVHESQQQWTKQKD